jgi:hypothetical protein
MKKQILLVILFLFSLYSYPVTFIKFTNEVKVGNIKFFKGEIFECYQQQGENLIIYGPYSVTIDFNKEKIENNVKVIKDYSSDQSKFVRKISNNKAIEIDFSKETDITTVDSIKVINEKNEKIAYLWPGQKTTINIETIGKEFRIIIPGTPTLVYSVEAIANVVIENKEQKQENENEQQDSEKFSLWSWVTSLPMYLIVIIVIVILCLLFGISYVIWPSFFKDLLNEDEIEEQHDEVPQYKHYHRSDGSLSDFARKNDINYEKLMELNPELVGIQAEDFFKDSKDKSKKLVVGYKIKTRKVKIPKQDESEKKQAQPDNTIKEKQDSEEKTDENNRGFWFNKSQIDSTIPADTINKLIRQLEKVEKYLKESPKMEDLKEKFDKMNTELKEVRGQLLQSNSNNSQLEGDLSKEKQYKEDAIREKNKYAEKIVLADEIDIRSIAEKYNEFLKLCEKGIEQAFTFNKSLDPDEDISKVYMQLFLKFHKNLPQDKDKWNEIIYGILENNVLSSPKIINFFKQYKDDDKKKTEFTRIISKEIKKYCSAILIFAEELSNFSKFVNNTDQKTKQIQEYYKVFSADLRKIISDTEDGLCLNLNYVSLFSNYTEKSKLVKIKSDREPSPAYININKSDLNNGDIIEIYSFGFGDDEKTEIRIK